MEEVQNRDWQHLGESVTRFVEHNKSHLKPLSKTEGKIIKSMKHNCRVARSVYASTYANMAGQFKIYLNSLPPDETDEIENYFRANGNSLLSVCETESATELFDSFAMFYYINGRLPYMDGHLFLPDGETSPGVIGEKLRLKELFANFLGRVQTVLFHCHFLLSSRHFLLEKKRWPKIFLPDCIKI